MVRLDLVCGHGFDEVLAGDVYCCCCSLGGRNMWIDVTAELDPRKARPELSKYLGTQPLALLFEIVAQQDKLE